MILVFVPDRAIASYDSYIEDLESIGVSKDFVTQNDPLYRNDMVRLLSTISCIDCLHPDKAIIEKYNAAWWGEFAKNP